MTLEELIVKIKADTSELESGVNKTKSVMSTIGKGVAVAAAAAGAAVVKIGKDALGAFAEFEQLEGGVKKIFGDDWEIVAENANKAFQTAGISANEYMEQVTSFSASLLQSLGGNTQAAAQTADMAIQDMADNANTFGTSMESIQNAYQGFAKQNYTMLDNLKLGYGGTKTEMERLLADAEELTGIKYDISNLNDVYNAIHVIQGEMNITGTTAKEATSTVEGSINSLAASWTNLLSSLMSGNNVKGATKSFIDGFMNVLNNIINLLPNFITGLSEALSTGLPQILPPIIDVIVSMLPTILDTIAQVIPPLISSVISTIWKYLPDILKALLQMIIKLGSDLISMIGQVLGTVWNSIKNWFSNVFSAAVNTLSNVVDKVLNFFKNIFNGVKEIVRNIINLFKGDFKTGVKNAFDAVKAIFTSIWNSIWSFLKGILNKMISGVESMINRIVSGLNTLLKPLRNAGNKLLSFLGIDFSIPSFSSVSLPRLAKGGIAYGTSLAMVGEYANAKTNPEVIAPLNKLNELLNTGLIVEKLDTLINVVDSKEFKTYISKSDIGKASIDYIRQQNRILGGAIV